MKNGDIPLSPVNRVIRYCLENKLIVFLAALFLITWGILAAPFDWEIPGLIRSPVPVDAIPDIGENQQIVFTEWHGRSPQDVEDQITYPLTTALLGLPEVKTIRSFSNFGFSTIYIIFREKVEYYWTRSRILEKLNSLSAGTLPEGVHPTLGPDATALGQVFWYTLEGRDEKGDPTEGWDLQERRSVQDWYVRYSLQGVDGVAEVASIGGFVKEYQVDVDPDAMRAYGVTLEQVYNAVRNSNIDVGARTLELNRVEYVIRGLGFVRGIDDLRKSVVKVEENVPITLEQIAEIELGPAIRRGVLDKEGAEAVGGVVVIRFGENPLAVIKRIKEKIQSISPGLPEKVLTDGTVSKMEIIPFYDRTDLIYETLGTLETAVSQQILITIIVVVMMILHLRSSLMISAVLPIAVLFTFIGMKLFGVDANVVALSGIAIAIGTIVDMGIVMSENILKHLDRAEPDENRLEIIFRASSEVGGAILTAVLTTVISFLPVFAMEGAEGKLFKPLAYTKTFALIASIIIALTIIPPLAHSLIAGRLRSDWTKKIIFAGVIFLGVFLPIVIQIMPWWLGGIFILIGIYNLTDHHIPENLRSIISQGINYLIALVVSVFLAFYWLPLGPEKGFFNVIFVILIIGMLLGLLYLFIRSYAQILQYILNYKSAFLLLVSGVVLCGAIIWLGIGTVFGFVPGFVKNTRAWDAVEHSFPGLGKEFMPPLDEGSYLFMPTTMPHASLGEALDVLQIQDMAISAIPEIDGVVGKIGRVESPLDPAPISMIETIVNYIPEYIVGDDGRWLKFKYDKKTRTYIRNENGELIEDRKGRPYRQWRDEIKSVDDIWEEIVRVSALPGTTSAPKLQPIAARIVMLQSGMRAPMGLKIYGPDLQTIEKIGLELEKLLHDVPSIEPTTVLADRVVGKPYLEIEIDREAIARYGMSIRHVQDVIEVAIGGRNITTAIEGRERYPIRIRYLRELRDDIESITRILVPAANGAQIPLGQLANIHYLRGPQVIKSEDTFLVGYVIFDKKPGFAEVDVVEQARAYLDEKIDSGELIIPSGASYKFTGSYENQVRAEKKLRLILPVALMAIFLILYFRFKKVSTTLMVFSGVLVAWSGGFIMIWLYSQDWFLNFSILGSSMRDIFQIHPINLSVAVWVGFLALFGIATDNGVIVGTYLHQVFEENKPKDIEAIRKATILAGVRRIRPAMMTVGTTILALLPVLASTGRGSNVMVPMAIPIFGGMILAIITVLIVPVLYCSVAELKVKLNKVNDKIN